MDRRDCEVIRKVAWHWGTKFAFATWMIEDPERLIGVTRRFADAMYQRTGLVKSWDEADRFRSHVDTQLKAIEAWNTAHPICTYSVDRSDGSRNVRYQRAGYPKWYESIIIKPGGEKSGDVASSGGTPIELQDATRDLASLLNGWVDANWKELPEESESELATLRMAVEQLDLEVKWIVDLPWPKETHRKMPTTESRADLDIQVRAHVLAYPALYEQAGRDIDTTYSPEACWKGDLAFYKAQPSYPVENYPTLDQWRSAAKRMQLKVVPDQLKHYRFDRGIPPADESAKVVLLHWVLTDQACNSAPVTLTGFQNWSVPNKELDHDLMRANAYDISDNAEWREYVRKALAVMQSQSAMAGRTAGVRNVVDAAEKLTSLYIDQLHHTVKYQNILAKNAEVKAAFCQDDSKRTRKLHGHERQQLVEAQAAADKPQTAEQSILPALEAARAALNREAIETLSEADVVREPVIWAIDLRNKLENLLCISSWAWEHPRFSEKDRWNAVYAIGPILNPVKHWLQMGAPGLSGQNNQARSIAVIEPVQIEAMAERAAKRAIESVQPQGDGVNGEAPRPVTDDRPMLSHKASVVYELLLKLPEHRGMTGPQIIDELPADASMDESTLRKSVVPALEPYGLEHVRKIGYRIKPSHRPPPKLSA